MARLVPTQAPGVPETVSDWEVGGAVVAVAAGGGGLVGCTEQLAPTLHWSLVKAYLVTFGAIEHDG